MRPTIHFTAQTGWINDPNGLVYKDGVYHLYFQQNPYGIEWGNISWGHAVSRDLLHWAQLETVMRPDENGMMFSGSGIVNSRALLSLPKDCLLFFYTAAGGTTPESEGRLFTQRVAYSTDGGKTLTKYNRGAIDTIKKENRDPKIFWHSKSSAYICVLWLEENDFAIMRSTDLEHWTQTQTLTLKDAWECPDLFRLSCDDGESRWVFWSADGFYFTGDFDGYTFTQKGERRCAYYTKLPYAAQTYSNVADRVITIPWLRTKEVKGGYCGAMGLPCELSLVKSDDGYILKQTPVKEYSLAKNNTQNGSAVEVHASGITNALECEYGGAKISYDPASGTLSLPNAQHALPAELKSVTMLFDAEILEIWANDFTLYAVYELPYVEKGCKIKAVCAGADISVSTIR
jgi:fructan beta-fructosidase